MSKGVYNVPVPVNEPVKQYAPGSPEKAELEAKLKEMNSEEIEIPMWIGGKEVKSGNLVPISPPHDHQRIIGHYHQGDKSHVEQAIKAAMEAKEAWVNLDWEHRASIFLKAADLLAGPYRQAINASTMLGQSKNAFQAEIDAACEFIDFLKFNVSYMTEIYKQQPASAPTMWNRVEHRPLEGFVFALTPFNFTSIAGNLPTAPAMMGNTVVWKASKTQIYSAKVLVDLFKEAGVPDGVINLVFVSGPEAGEVIFDHPDFAGFHFTGSTGVFQNIWKTVGNNIHKYKTYPRIVGETGGKDFIVAHKSADAKALATGIVRGAFEYQGQKCSAASRAYVPDNLWEEVKGYVLEDLASIKMGDVEDFGNFVNAVIDEASFDNIASFVEAAKTDSDAEIIAGGG
ncbi:MAG: aldehyde dehydrogenase family protein, partial [Flavobacteriales bacterium]|nr:aldehyde dehydrogenase family protein [Flavobacteriales bacterium]